MAYEFYLGIDGQSPEKGRLHFTTALIEKSGDAEEVEYSIRSLRRYEDKSVEDVADAVIDELRADPFVGRTVPVANTTENPGRKLHGALTSRGLSPMHVTLTGGDTSTQQGRALSFSDAGAIVSEHEIVSTVEDVYRSGRLETAPAGSEEVSELARGLEDYHVRSGSEGEALEEKDFSPSRSGKHADLVLAVGIACWLGEQHSFNPAEHLDEEPPPVYEAKREMRPDTTS